MKTVYSLKVQERDDYFYSNDTLVCKILNIDESEIQTVEHITKVNGVETKRTVNEKVMVDGEFRELNSYWDGRCFDSLVALKKYIEDEYELVKSAKDKFFFLSIDDLRNSVVVVKNYEDSFFECTRGYVDLQKLLGLKHESKDKQ